ncbi:MAG TPA: histidine triad nucleotide-binding protein [Deltaproteobacteria bacterium]|nr:MAG: histidine triad nucleotide-binding protein [Deltaproteobacteria bacterium GWA2_55_82]OGQ64777.1 MAG: histidine triad nucleotide-binding protein [Deltaproteobacteria bacterium RIFCSPLOWO2_02_FULL_55_12]OIJ72625.1 MAG: histidine triad nucleotide-binding protein [Deltaproteobacteria bacterium GWC2_55_46]HBG47227.1 histidine triad nucleotide-binding protein [Deltaproteobacteria bacterium]HCY11971.1 histidine triad nucleotide-binding protein [Deltaproteobacteria bacterium]
MSDCIFCRIAKKEIKSTIVLESEDLIVIKDVNPQSPTHLLIMPKAHYPTLLDCDDRELLGKMIETAKKAARELGVDKRGFRIVINTNEEGGQTVFHLHMHLMAGKPLAGRMG